MHCNTISTSLHHNVLNTVFDVSGTRDWQCQAGSVRDIATLEFATDVDDFEPCFCSLRASGNTDIDVRVMLYDYVRITEQNRVTLVSGKKTELPWSQV